jgi:type III secretory pathway component EscU
LLYWKCYIGNVIQGGRKVLRLQALIEVAQSTHKVALSNAIIKFIGIGYLKPKFNIK